MVLHSSEVLDSVFGKAGSGVEPAILPLEDKEVAGRLIRVSPHEMTGSIEHGY
jgi:hypothetical protein